MNTLRPKLQEQYSSLSADLITSLAQMVHAPSVISSESTPSMPFGKGIDRCLESTLSICEQLGFRTFKDPEGYYGYAEVGQGEDLIGILCHLDVVPVEDPDHWIADPFTLTQQGDKLIARGTADNKGPTVVCIYALKALLNIGFTFQKRIRLIFGTDEESLWRCMAQYKLKEEIPSMGFTPDASFPVIFAEKGLLQFILKGKGEEISISGGGAFNSVPLEITYTGPNQKDLARELRERDFEYTQQQGVIIIQGKAAHAQSTEKGINPISRLMICLRAIGVSSPSIDFITDKIHENPYGELLLGKISDEESGILKTNFARVEITPQSSQLFFDFRIPISYPIDQLIDSIQKIALEYGLEFQCYDKVPPLYLPKDHHLIKTLSAIYHEETGNDPTPLSMGGATYSRVFSNFVTFGMSFPDTQKTSHQTNESISLCDIKKAFIIYARAIAQLDAL